MKLKQLLELLGDAFLITYGLWIIVALTFGIAWYEPDVKMRIFEALIGVVILAVGVERLIDDLKRIN